MIAGSPFTASFTTEERFALASFNWIFRIFVLSNMTIVVTFGRRNNNAQPRSEASRQGLHKVVACAESATRDWLELIVSTCTRKVLIYMMRLSGTLSTSAIFFNAAVGPFLRPLSKSEM